jgi:hypothetical protein
VVRPDFKKGNFNNNWEGVFPDFADQIEKFIGSSTKELVECNFSNTTKIDLVVSQIALMDICKYYFEYRFVGGCGIPYIELMGTVDDWKKLREKVSALSRFSLEEDKHLELWLKEMISILDHFVSASEGSPDLYFWGSVCNLGGGSGSKGKPLTGWITVFFPYLIDNRKNADLPMWRKAYFEAKTKGIERVLAESQTNIPDFVLGGLPLTKIPQGIFKADVLAKWLDINKEEKLIFYSGLTTLYQHADGALEVRTGWAVLEETESGKNYFKKRLDY